MLALTIDFVCIYEMNKSSLLQSILKGRTEKKFSKKILVYKEYFISIRDAFFAHYKTINEFLEIC